jgi:hypothetical protein
LKDNYYSEIKSIKDILDNISIILIYTDSHKSGSRIFENINSKGVQLSNVDVIKNAFFSRIDVENGQDDYRSRKYAYWTEIEKNIYSKSLSNNNNLTNAKMKTISRKYKSNIDTFFRSLLILNTGNSPSNTGYNLSKEFVCLIDSSEDKLKFLNKTQNISSSSKFILYPHAYTPPYSQIYNIHDGVKFISNLGVKQHIPLFIALYYRMIILNEMLSDREISNIENAVFKMAVFHFLFNRVASLRPSKIESLYKALAYKIYSDKISSKKISEEIERIVAQHKPTKIEVMSKLDSLLFTLGNKKNIRKKLKKLELDDYTKEYKTYDSNREVKFVFALTEVLSGKQYSRNSVETIEHIYNRGQDKIDLRDYKNFKLNGLLPLERDINDDCGSQCIISKINLYRKSNYYLVKKFVKNYDENKNSRWEEKWIGVLAESLLKLI